MRLQILAIGALALIVVCCPDAALARGRKGSGKGGGGGRPSFAGGNGGGHKEYKEHKEHKEHKQHAEHKDKLADSSQGKTHDKPGAKQNGGGLTDAGEAYNKKQKQLEIEQRNRDKRLAQAEHLRQIAERNGNPNLAANADRMEAFAYDHYARRVEHVEKFGVTDPTLDPGVVTDPLIDPAGEFTELPLPQYPQWWQWLLP
jgi:hypothetical protein